MKEIIVRARGFTLVEMLFAVVIVSVLTLAAIGFFKQFTLQARKVTDAGRMDGAFRSFGQHFLVDVKGADAALHFQRLPVPTSGCGLDGPCLLQLKADETLAPASSSVVGGAETVDFFSDRSAELKTRSLGSKGGKTQLRFEPPVNLSAIRGTDQRIYAAWTLKSPSSPPFVLMTRSRTADYFVFAEQFASGSPSGSAGRWVIFEGSRADIEVEDLALGLVAVYNGHDPSQYFIQRIKSAISCRTNANCKTIAKALNPGFDVGLFASQPYFAFELEPVSENALSRFLPPAKGIKTRWWSQPQSHYMFPSLSASLNDAEDKDFATPIDARKLAHYYHAQQMKSQLMAVPIELRAYRIERKRKSKILYEETFPNGRKKVALEDIPEKQSVVFGRLLGTSSVSVLLYE